MFAYHERGPTTSQGPSCRDQSMGLFYYRPSELVIPLSPTTKVPPWSFKSKFTEDKRNTRSSWLLAPESSFV